MGDGGLIEWHEGLALGLEVLDEDHRKLVATINALAMRRVEGGSGPEFLQLFEQLRRYARDHFRDEEALMEGGAVSSSHFDAHVAAHAGFVAYLDKAGRVLATDPGDVIGPLLAFLVTWFEQHVAGMDAQMGRELAACVDRDASAPGAAGAHPALFDSAIADPETNLNQYHDLAVRNVELLNLNRELLKQIEAKQHTRAELAVSEAKQRLAQHVFETMAEAVVVTDTKVRIQSVTPAFTRITGYTEHDVQGRSVFTLISRRHDKAFNRGLKQQLRQQGTWAGEAWYRFRNGDAHPMWQTISALRDPHGRITHYIAVLSDLREIHRARDVADQLSWRDPLTGLANRALFIQELARALVGAQREHRYADVLLIDIDRFKVINEARGLTAGDALLLAVADCLTATLHPDDLIARLDSDEFAIMLPRLMSERDGAAQAALMVAEKVHTALRAGVALGSETVHIDVSIGIAVSIGNPILHESPHETARDVLRQGQLAMRRAKAAGGGHTVFFESEMGAAVKERYELEHALGHAIADGQLRVHLQRQVDARGRQVGAEALVRWEHPDHGLISPAKFIPVAENSDLIVSLDRWVLGEVCTLLGRLDADGRSLRTAVNISPRHFQKADFADHIRRLLADTGADPNHLVLEVTEGLFIDDPAAVAAKMLELCELGVRFSLDDFGTGYSSLAHLKRLPIHELKIDQSFIRDVNTDPNDAALVKTILAVATHLNLQVVAEGVENLGQAQFLDQREGVVRQGYYYGRPEPVHTWLEKLALPDAPAQTLGNAS